MLLLPAVAVTPCGPGCPGRTGANAAQGRPEAVSLSEHAVQEPRQIREDLGLVRLVEHLVPGAGIDPLGEVAAAELLDADAAAGKGDQPVVVAVQPQQREP